MKFTKFFSQCNGDSRFFAFARFLKYYGHVKFDPCARKIIQDLEHQLGDFGETFKQRLNALNKVFGTGLEVDGGSLSDQDMYNYLKDVDLTTCEFAIDHMGAKVNVQKLVSKLRKNLYKIKILVKANIVNIARGIKAIEEKELTDKFRLINEYARLAAQMLNEKCIIDIEEHFAYLDSHEHRVARMGGARYRFEN